ncbi:hypothetical protein EXD76_09085 [BEV proteobacterium]|nr:hypothetical protein [Candidatus Symbiopectobacterium sp. Chty_BC]
MTGTAYRRHWCANVITKIYKFLTLPHTTSTIHHYNAFITCIFYAIDVKPQHDSRRYGQIFCLLSALLNKSELVTTVPPHRVYVT